MRARSHVYHVDCFRCVACGRQLIPGDEFALGDEGLLCRVDHDLAIDHQHQGLQCGPAAALKSLALSPPDSVNSEDNVAYTTTPCHNNNNNNNNSDTTTNSISGMYYIYSTASKHVVKVYTTSNSVLSLRSHTLRRRRLWCTTAVESYENTRLPVWAECGLSIDAQLTEFTIASLGYMFDLNVETRKLLFFILAWMNFHPLINIIMCMRHNIHKRIHSR